MQHAFMQPKILGKSGGAREWKSYLKWANLDTRKQIHIDPNDCVPAAQLSNQFVFKFVNQFEFIICKSV